MTKTSTVTGPKKNDYASPFSERRDPHEANLLRQNWEHASHDHAIRVPSLTWGNRQSSGDHRKVWSLSPWERETVVWRLHSDLISLRTNDYIHNLVDNHNLNIQYDFVAISNISYLPVNRINFPSLRLEWATLKLAITAGFREICYDRALYLSLPAWVKVLVLPTTLKTE